MVWYLFDRPIFTYDRSEIDPERFQSRYFGSVMRVFAKFLRAVLPFFTPMISFAAASFAVFYPATLMDNLGLFFGFFKGEEGTGRIIAMLGVAIFLLYIVLKASGIIADFYSDLYIPAYHYVVRFIRRDKTD